MSAHVLPDSPHQQPSAVPAAAAAMRPRSQSAQPSTPPVDSSIAARPAGPSPLAEGDNTTVARPALPTGKTTAQRRRGSKRQQSHAQPRTPKSAPHQACAACKARKVRCDATRPACSYCASRAQTCIYPPIYKRALCSQSYVESLEAKLRDLQAGTSRGVNGSITDGSIEAAVTETRGPSTSSSPSPSSLSPQANNRQQAGGYGFSLGLGSTDSFQREPPETVVQRSTLSTQLSLAGDSTSIAASGQQSENILLQSSYGHIDHDDLQTPQCPSPGVSSERQYTTTSHVGRDDQDDPGDLPSAADEPAIAESGGADNVENGPVTDGMVQYTDSSPESHEGVSYYGDSSTLRFAMNLKASAINEGQRPSSNIGSRSVPQRAAPCRESIAISNGPPITLTGLDSFSVDQHIPSLDYLPQRHIARSLLDIYFTSVHTVWPFLLEEATRQQFDKTWFSDNAPSPIWMAQLNLIFALASELWDGEGGNQPSEEVLERGRQFYLNARQFILQHAFNMSSISMLQALLLMVQYQQGTMQSEQCWLTIGHATRMAQALGLHRHRLNNPAITPLERELHNRLWWGCFSLDKVSSMTYGRPAGIPHVQISIYEDNLPQAVDDQYINLGKSQPSGVPSLNSFFRNTVTLYLVMDEILNLLYETNTVGNLHGSFSAPNQVFCLNHRIEMPTKPSMPAAIIQLDDQLLAWHRALPDHLRFSLDKLTPNSDLSRMHQRQRTILRGRFLGMRILLHRQTLLYLLQPPASRTWLKNLPSQRASASSNASAEDTVENALGAHAQSESASHFDTHIAQISASICASSAELQIESIYMSRQLGLTAAWWWDFHFTVNSLCVLFGAMSLQQNLLATVIPDMPRVKKLIHCGFKTINAMGRRGGAKVIQTERFLRQLMCATIPTRFPGTIPHSREASVSAVLMNNNAEDNTSLSAASSAAVMGSSSGANIPNFSTRENTDGAWAPNNASLPMEVLGGNCFDGFDANGNTDFYMVENMLHTSFDYLWNNSYDAGQQPDGYQPMEY